MNARHIKLWWMETLGYANCPDDPNKFFPLHRGNHVRDANKAQDSNYTAGTAIVPVAVEAEQLREFGTEV